MPEITFSYDDKNLVSRLGKVLPSVEDALESALRPVALDMAARARALAVAHIRYAGEKPGLYVASIYGNTFRKPGTVGGFVRSTSPLAHLLEQGFTYPEQDIFPKVKQVMSFMWNGEQTFRKKVHRQSTPVPAYPAIGPAFQDTLGEVKSAMQKAAATATAEI